MEVKLHKGIFCFLNKQGCSIHEMRRILSLYALEIGIKRPKKARLEWYANISEEAQKDFTAFKKCYNENKIKGQKRQSYDDYFQECSFDGTFAYNGVADDF